MSSSASLVGGGYGSGGSQSIQAAMYADMFTAKCDTGFIVLGLQHGEAACTPIRVISTLVAVSMVSTWFSQRVSIKKLLLFFSHWLSGLTHGLAFMAEATMLSVCWAGEHLEWFIKTLKFVELASANMYAVTNLAICVNLSFIVRSHRTLTRVKSASSPNLILLFLAISVGATASSAPFWEYIVLSGTGFWVGSNGERAIDWVPISMFMLEFFVGVCMLVMVTWLLLFWREEIKESWKLHARIRYYFCLTVIGTAVYLSLGISGTIHVAHNRKDELLLVVSWGFRFLHIALDTIVLYGVLGSRNLDERAASIDAVSGEGDGDYPVGVVENGTTGAGLSKHGSTDRSSSSSTGSSSGKETTGSSTGPPIQQWD